MKTFAAQMQVALGLEGDQGVGRARQLLTKKPSPGPHEFMDARSFGLLIDGFVRPTDFQRESFAHLCLRVNRLDCLMAAYDLRPPACAGCSAGGEEWLKLLCTSKSAYFNPSHTTTPLGRAAVASKESHAVDFLVFALQVGMNESEQMYLEATADEHGKAVLNQARMLQRIGRGNGKPDQELGAAGRRAARLV